MRSGAAPLEVSARVSCRFRDGDFYSARVIERRKRDPQRSDDGPLLGDNSDFEYYVHYDACAPPACAASPLLLPPSEHLLAQLTAGWTPG